MKIGIIGGPFFWDIWDVSAKQIDTKTPYGSPSDSLFYGRINDHEVYTLLRHGSRNQYCPNTISYLANIYSLGLQNLDLAIQITACGSLLNDMDSGDIFLFDQIIDYTKNRPVTFGEPLFDKVHHLNFGAPISTELIKHAHETFKQNKINHTYTGTMLTEEGPRFSTAAETNMYKILGAQAINQTSCPELYLFRELGIPVVAMSLVTNKVDKDSHIEADEISKNIVDNNRVIPNAVKIFIEALSENQVITKPSVTAYDVSKFDLRK